MDIEDIIVKCPACGELYSRELFRSVNVLPCYLYSDWTLHTPIDELPSYAKCKKKELWRILCGNFRFNNSLL